MAKSPWQARDLLSAVTDLASTLGENAKIFLIGVCMGIADGVPGVSGGTIALIAGIYERLIDAVAAITTARLLDFGAAVAPFETTRNPDRVLDVLDDLDARFLCLLLAGMISAIVSVGQVIGYARLHAPVVLYGFFFGLIGASGLLLLREIRIDTPRLVLPVIVGFVAAFLLSGQTQLFEGGGLIAVFVAGSLAVSAMILPGISGSLILILVGQYERMYAALNEITLGAAGELRGQPLTSARPATEVAVFILGGIVGVLTVARVIEALLEWNRSATLAFLSALVLGALRAPIHTLSSIDEVTWTVDTASKFAIVACVAAVLVFLAWTAADPDLEAF